PSGNNATLLDWNPGADSRVATLAVSPGAILAGGNGDRVGRGRHQAQPYLAAFDRQGNLLPWNPGANSSVNTLAVHNNVLYAGGLFTPAGGQPREHLAAFTVANVATPGNPATLLDWNPGANGWVYTLAVHNNVLYAGGNFTLAGGQRRERLAAFPVANGATPGTPATLLDWNPRADGTVSTLAVHDNVLYAAGIFIQAGGKLRERLAAFTVANGATSGNSATLLDWNPGANGWVSTLALHDNVLYAGASATQSGGQPRERSAAFSVATGATAATSAALLARSLRDARPICTLAVHDNVLYAGGSFTQAGGQPRERLAAFTVANGATPEETATLLDWNPGTSD